MMASRGPKFLAVCLAALFIPATYAQDAWNGVTNQTPGSSPRTPGGLSSTVPVGGPWTEFAFYETGTFAIGCAPLGTACVPSSSGNSVFGGDPPWTFTAPTGGATLIVTDAFLLGDRFEVFDFGALLGATSTTADGDCGDDPDPCVADFASNGFFFLAPGPHEITIRMLASPFGSGAAYFRVEASAMDFYTVMPCRVVDTRGADGPWGGPSLASGQPRSFLIAGQCGIPEDAQAVSVNVTAIDPTRPGFLRVVRAGLSGASTSNVNFGAGQIRANNGIVALAGGRLSMGLFVDPSPGNVHVVIDVNGYFR